MLCQEQLLTEESQAIDRFFQEEILTSLKLFIGD